MEEPNLEKIILRSIAKNINVILPSCCNVAENSNVEFS